MLNNLWKFEKQNSLMRGTIKIMSHKRCLGIVYVSVEVLLFVSRSGQGVQDFPTSSGFIRTATEPSS